MLFLIWTLLFLTAACLILFMPALWGKHIYNNYRGTRTVNCPETHAPVSVRINALRAAITGLSGKPKVSLASCTRWPERAGCDQACIPDAERAIPEPKATTAVRRASSRVAHLPARFRSRHTTPPRIQCAPHPELPSPRLSSGAGRPRRR